MSTKSEVSISRAALMERYASSSDEGKKLLEELYGPETFVPDIMDRVKTFEDACAVLGIDPSAQVVIGDDPESGALRAIRELTIVAKALNQGWKPDWSNDDERKYYPWFDLSSGSSASFFDYVRDCSYSCVGSRLVFKSKELAEHAGKQFLSTYERWMVIKD
jgi:hypothetical protein